MKTFSIQPGPVRPSVSSGASTAPRGHDEDVVGELLPVAEVDPACLQLDAVDGVDAVLDAAVQLAAAGADDVLGVGEPEGDEEEPGLVDVAVVLVDDGDRRPRPGRRARRSRFAASVPPVPPPRITMRCMPTLPFARSMVCAPGGEPEGYKVPEPAEGVGCRMSDVGCRMSESLRVPRRSGHAVETHLPSSGQSGFSRKVG